MPPLSRFTVSTIGAAVERLDQRAHIRPRQAWPCGIVNQHPVTGARPGAERPHAAEYRLLTARTADRAQYFGGSPRRGALLSERIGERGPALIVGGHDHHHGLDARLLEECAQRPLDQARTEERRVLFGGCVGRGVEPRAAAGGGHDGENAARRHRRNHAEPEEVTGRGR
jgi:hypothetical protein